jgi:hypothetical protein
LDLKSVTNELGSVMAKYYPIGVQLGVPETKIEEIEMNYGTADRRFSEVIKFWLRENTSVAKSWESLVEVLESPFVNEKGLARKMREKIVSKAVSVPGATESGGQPQETTGGQRGKKSTAEEKLDDGDDQQPERQGTYYYYVRIMDTSLRHAQLLWTRGAVTWAERKSARLCFYKVQD